MQNLRKFPRGVLDIYYTHDKGKEAGIFIQLDILTMTPQDDR